MSTISSETMITETIEKPSETSSIATSSERRTAPAHHRGLTLTLILMILMFVSQIASAQYPSFSQNDGRWRTHTVGFSSDTMAHVGCLANCVTSLEYRFGLYKDPASMDDYLKQRGAYSGPLLVWANTPNYRTMLDYRSVAANVSAIKAKFSQGYAIVLETRKSGYQHWVLMTGWNSAGQLTIMDPWDGANGITFVSRYGSEARWIYRAGCFRNY